MDQRVAAAASSRIEAKGSATTSFCDTSVTLEKKPAKWQQHLGYDCQSNAVRAKWGICLCNSNQFDGNL